MNKDKELEEALETIKNSYVMSTKHCLDDENVQLKQAIKTVLQTLESYKERYELAIEQNIKDYNNSIPKKKIEDVE